MSSIKRNRKNKESLITNIANAYETEDCEIRDGFYLLFSLTYGYEIGRIAREILTINQRITFRERLEYFKDDAESFGLGSEVEQAEKSLDAKYLWLTRDNFYIEKIICNFPCILFFCGVAFVNLFFGNLDISFFELFLIFIIFNLYYIVYTIDEKLIKSKKTSEIILKNISRNEYSKEIDRINIELEKKGWIFE